jgi:hypothetical protein
MPYFSLLQGDDMLEGGDVVPGLLQLWKGAGCLVASKLSSAQCRDSRERRPVLPYNVSQQHCLHLFR